MNAPKLHNVLRFGTVASNTVARSRWYVPEKQIVKSLGAAVSAAIAAATGANALNIELFDRGADGTGTTLLARVSIDTTTYPAETATTIAAALPANGVGLRKDLSSRNAAVAAQGVGYEKIEGTNVLAGTFLEVIVTSGATGPATADLTIDVEYAPGQN